MSFAGGLKTIVVATDLEGRSEAALEYARKLASAYGARIILAHGSDPLEYAVVDEVPGRVWERLSAQARAALDEMSADLIREGIHSHSEIRQGTVVDMLVEVARQYEAGLIVVGTKGRQGAGPIAVGAIAEELVRKSPCPVLAVAADWNAGEFRPIPGGPVMLAVERNDAARAAVETAASLAQVFKRALLVVHARESAEVRHSESGRDRAGGIRAEAGRGISGAFDRQGRKPCRRSHPGHCTVQTEHPGGGREAQERFSGAARNGICAVDQFPRAGPMRTCGGRCRPQGPGRPGLD
jgi:nucleotide-binding universal stress UspA family protein